MNEQTTPISTGSAKRRSTRVVHSAPLILDWIDSQPKTMGEEAETVSVNCHGFRCFSRREAAKHERVTIQVISNHKDKLPASPAIPGYVTSTRKSRQLEGMHLLGIEFETPRNIWKIDEAPEDWAAFSPAEDEDAEVFLAEVDRALHSTRNATYYQLLGVQRKTSRSEVRQRFYQLAGRFHPDHHMDHPEWTPRLSALMESLTAAYKTLSNEEMKKEYDALVARRPLGDLSDSRAATESCLDNADACIAEKNFAGGILWLRRAIENEPNHSSHRALLGRCLSAIPEYRNEAAEQFEKAIDLDPRNISAHFHYANLFEVLRLPWQARKHYLRVLELDANHREAQECLQRLAAGLPRASAKPSLLGRLKGQR